MADQNAPLGTPIVIPQWVLTIVNYAIKVGLPFIAAVLFARYGIVLPIQQSNERVIEAVHQNTLLMKEVNSWK